MTDIEPSFLEAKHSILHAVEESMREKKYQTHRMVCISKIIAGVSTKNIGEHFSNVVKEIPQPEDVSGLLLIFPMHCVHIVEGATETLLAYLRDLRKQKYSLFTHSKILVVAHNITTTLYQNWMSHELDIQATGIGEYETSEPTENIVIEIVVNVIKIGAHLSKQPKLSYNTAVQALHEKVPEALPQQVLNVDKKLLIATDVLEYLLERPDPSLQTVEEFLQIYESPYKITPASGKYKQQELNILSITAAD
ncbi:C7orf62 [Bugula neritina]|uniref:C7orf62 n=1 Tax=Bugula neritina TaxID=10212 RepID=A0A7J7IWR0_BUGNE|nr:C7orf62 [Bugula neritina]